MTKANNNIVKIKQPNQSEIEVQLQTNKKKLAYYKNLEEPTNKNTHKKQIQINTNLEPSQSKKQYKIALV